MNDHQQKQYDHAVRLLLNLGFDLKDLFAQREKREAEPARPPTEEDLRFQITTPESWHSHFAQLEEDLTVKTGLKEVGGLRELSTSTARQGGQFTLSKLWRDVLRERCGLTPTSTIVVSELTFKPGTRVVDRMKIESVQHIADVKNRKHLLQAYTITNFTAFMLEVVKQMELSANAVKVSEPKESKTPTNKPITKSTAAIMEDYL